MSKITTLKEYNKKRGHLSALRLCRRIIQNNKYRDLARWYQRQEELAKLEAIENDIYWNDKMEYERENWEETRREQDLYYHRLDAIDDYWDR